MDKEIRIIRRSGRAYTMALNAKLHIRTAYRDNKTILQNTFCTPPFKVANVTENKKQIGLELMIMSSSPGILDNDEYNLQIDLDSNCSLELKTQAYQRLYKMKNGAKQFLNVNMQKHSSLTYIPHPSVPHENSIFLSRNKISLEEGCSLVWGEVISCGRKLNGEVFKFSSYQNITEVFIKNKLAIKENILIKPSEIDVNAIGQLEGYTHQGSLLCIDGSIDVEEAKDNIVSVLNDETDIVFGVSILPVKGLIVRLLGNKSEQLFDLLKNISIVFSQKKIKESFHVA